MLPLSEARKKHWRKQLDYLVENGMERMSEWEQGFIDDLSIRFEGKDVDLNMKQSFKLGEIYARVVERVG
jgi:hypothetical protein